MSSPGPIPEVSGSSLSSALEQWLAAATDSPGLRIRGEPCVLGGGLETRTYAICVDQAPESLPRELVLRLFNEHDWPTRSKCEAAIWNGAGLAGLPVPRVLFAETDSRVLGAPFLISERAPGRPLRAFPHNMWRLGGLMAQIHDLGADFAEQAIRKAGLDPTHLTLDSRLRQLRTAAAKLEVGGLVDAVDWLQSQRPPEPNTPVLCHCDLFPANVVAERGRVTGILDWSARLVVIGDPHADLGVVDSLQLFRPKMPPGLRSFGRRGTRWMSGLVVRAYTRHRACDTSRLRYYRLFNCIRLVLAMSEHRLGVPGVLRPGVHLGAWTAPERLTGYLAHVEEEMGVRVQVPG